MSDAAAYLLAHFAKSQLWHASTVLFGFFLTEACGMDAATMGAVMAGSLLVNGVMDGLIGRRARRTPGGLATGLRRQGLHAGLACLFFMGFCATPLFGPDQRLPWAVATILAFRMAYACVDVPQNAAVSVISDDVDARCVLLSRRNIASALANLAVGVVAGGLLIHGRGIGLWLAWAGSVSILACATAARLQRLAPRARNDGRGFADPTHLPIPPVGQELAPFGALLASLAVLMFACSSFRSFEPYYAAYVGKGIGLMAAAAIGGMVSQPLWVACRRCLGMRATLAIIASLLILAALTVMGAWRTDRIGIVIVGVNFGAGTSGLWLMLWTNMLAHAATDHAMARAGIFTCLSKLAQGAAMLLLGTVMAASAYRTSLANVWSAPSLLMAGSLAAMAGACLILLFGSTRMRARVS